MITICLGRILNRFSKDVGFMDDLLTYLYAEFLIVRHFESMFGLRYIMLNTCNVWTALHHAKYM